MNNEDKKTKCECAKLDLLLVCKHCDEDGDCNENRYRLYYRRKPRPGKPSFIWAQFYKPSGSLDLDSRFSTGTTNLADARKKAVEVRSRFLAESGLVRTAKFKSLSYLMERWIADDTFHKSHNELTTYKAFHRAYVGTIGYRYEKVSELTPDKLLKMVCNRVLRSQRAGNLNRAKDDGQIKSHTLLREMTTLKSVYTYGVKRNLVLASPGFILPDSRDFARTTYPGSEFINPSGRSDTNVFRPSYDYVEKFLFLVEAIADLLFLEKSFSTNGRYGKTVRANALAVSRGLFAAVMTLGSGVRSQELDKLSYGDFKWSVGAKEVKCRVDTTRVGKNEKQVNHLELAFYAPLAWKLYSALKQNFERVNKVEAADNHLLFYKGRIGESITSTGKVPVALQKALAVLDIPQKVQNDRGTQSAITITSLRHYFISDLILRKGIPIDTVALIAGTSRKMIKDHYLDESEDDVSRIWDSIRSLG